MESAQALLTLSPQAYLVVYVVGAAVLAMWLYLRFPRIGPSDVTGVTLHLVASVLAANLVAPAAFGQAGSDGAMLAVTLGVVLPCVMYVLLSGIWLIRLGQGMLSRFSR